MDPTTLDLERQLRFAGLRVTRSRTTVLAAVQAHAHADTDMVVDAARRTLSDLSRQAVHDSLRALVEVGLVRQFQLGSVVRFELHDDDHHHAVCTSCGRIANVDCVGGGPSCLSPADSRGFLVSAVEVVYRGLCSDCAGRSGGDPGLLDKHHDRRLPASHAGHGARPEPALALHRADAGASATATPPTATRVSSYPSGRRARLGRVASEPPPDPLASQLSASDPWSELDRPLRWTDDVLASSARSAHQPSGPRTSPEPIDLGEPAPATAPGSRHAWLPAEPRRARSGRAADERPRLTTPVDDADRASGAHRASGADATGRTAADALSPRRRARHEASRPQPV